jgi:DNA-binding PadR family transcriptional regulator
LRYPFLALLAKSPAHGYELKQAFEELFGDVWPELNFGQVYTTLARLERDGLVRGQEVAQEHRRDKKVYEVTLSGEEALRDWIADPVDGPWLKDEFFMKLVLAQVTGAADERELIERQRRAYMQTLHDLNEQARRHRGEDAWVPSLLIEGAALHLDADLKWLDLYEEALLARRTPVLSGAAH